jgi:hypothetical protein
MRRCCSHSWTRSNQYGHGYQERADGDESVGEMGYITGNCLRNICNYSVDVCAQEQNGPASDRTRWHSEKVLAKQSSGSVVVDLL